MDTHPGNVQRKSDRGLLPPPHPLTGSPGKVAREPRWAQALCCLGMAGSWCGQTGCCLSSSHRGPPSHCSAALRWPAPTSRHTSLLSRGVAPLPEKSSVLSLLSLLLSQLLETTERILFFYCLHSFAFSRISNSWNDMVYRLFRLAFSLSNNLRILHVILWLDGKFSFNFIFVVIKINHFKYFKSIVQWL